MPIISNKIQDFGKYHFLFRESFILLQNGELPDLSTMKKCLELNVAEDWLSEPEMDYSAIQLEADSPDPAGCEAIPVRQFFHEKDEDLASLAARARGILNFKMSKQYCSKCGGKLENDPDFSARTCVQCGKQFFPQLEPAVIVLVNKGEEILLAQHKNRNDGMYGCIAGFVEIGETVENAVKREVLEETGLTVKNIRYVGSQSWPFPDQLMLAFRAEYDGGEIKVQEDELKEAAWFKRTSLPKVPPPGSVAHNLISGVFEDK